MSVDKFGRHSYGRRQRVIKGPKGDGYTITPEGDYNILGKRLVNVSSPVESGDAVNFKFVNQNLLGTSGEEEGVFDAKFKRIKNVHTPLDDTDAVDFKTLREYGPSFDAATNKISASGYVLSDLAAPLNKNDAATKDYVDNVKVPLVVDRSADFGERRLTRVADPVEQSDAINLKYLQVNTLAVTSGGYDCKKRKLSNLSSPERLDDAVNKRYLYKLLAELSYILYLKSAPTQRSWTPDDWVSRVLELNGDNQETPSPLFWDELFQINSPPAVRIKEQGKE